MGEEEEADFEPAVHHESRGEKAAIERGRGPPVQCIDIKYVRYLLN